MTVTIDGTTGVSLVQDGVVTAADLASGAITASALPAGSVLQVVNNEGSGNISIANSGAGRTYTNLISLNITPSSASNKIFIMYSVGHTGFASTSPVGAHGVVVYDGSVIFDNTQYDWYGSDPHPAYPPSSAGHFLISPSTTNQITYTLRGYSHNENSGTHTPVFTKYRITAMEIAG